jgi:serine/threonine-protein kinase RsbW
MVEWSAQYDLPSVPHTTGPVVEELLIQLRNYRWSEHDIFGIHLTLEEALTNAMEHGNRVLFSCQCSADYVRCEISDEGSGFDPAEVPDPREESHLDQPRGRGLLLMRTYMSRVEYLDQGKRVVLEKSRTERHHAA